MIKLELSLKTTAIGIQQQQQKQFEATKDWMLQLIHNQEQRKELHSIKKERTKFATELKIETAVGSKLLCTVQARNRKRRAKQE